jgi:hypothetical protein
MNSLTQFWMIELVLVVLPVLVFFKSKNEFVNCLYSFLFVEYYSSWKNVYSRHRQRSLRFAAYLVIVIIVTALNVVFIL